MRKGYKLTAILTASAIAAVVVFGGYAWVKHSRNAARKEGIGIRPAYSVKASAQNQSKPNGIGVHKATLNAKPADAQELRNRKAPPFPTNLPDSDELRTQFRMLKSFLELSPERLQAIRESIEKIEAMPQDEKQRLLAAIGDVPNSPNSVERRIERANAILEKMPKVTRDLVEARTKGFTKERRADFIEGYAAACEDVKKATATKPANKPNTK